MEASQAAGTGRIITHGPPGSYFSIYYFVHPDVLDRKLLMRGRCGF